MASQGNDFNQLCAKWNAPGSDRFVKVLQLMVTSEEGQLLLELWTPILAEERYQRRLTGQPSVHRILTAIQAIQSSPNLRPDQILWYEDLNAMLDRSPHNARWAHPRLQEVCSCCGDC